jgi:hypothetical protein
MAQWCNWLPWNSYTQSDRSSSVIQLLCDLYTIRRTKAPFLLARFSRVGTLFSYFCFWLLFTMSKRIRLSLSAQEKQSTDWSKCFICQELPRCVSTTWVTNSARMLDMPHDTLALVPQHLLRLILPNVFDLLVLMIDWARTWYLVSNRKWSSKVRFCYSTTFVLRRYFQHSDIWDENAMLKQGVYQLPLSCLCIQEKIYINSKRWFTVTCLIEILSLILFHVA